MLKNLIRISKSTRMFYTKHCQIVICFFYVKTCITTSHIQATLTQLTSTSSRVHAHHWHHTTARQQHGIIHVSEYLSLARRSHTLSQIALFYMSSHPQMISAFYMHSNQPSCTIYCSMWCLSSGEARKHIQLITNAILQPGTLKYSHCHSVNPLKTFAYE